MLAAFGVRGAACVCVCCPVEECSLNSWPPVPSQAERNNGRAAMMGIIGMMTHNALGVDALFPIVQ